MDAPDKKGNWLPNKGIVSPRESRNVVLSPEDLTKIVIFITKREKYLKGKKVLSHAKHGKKKEPS